MKNQLADGYGGRYGSAPGAMCLSALSMDCQVDGESESDDREKGGYCYLMNRVPYDDCEEAYSCKVQTLT